MTLSMMKTDFINIAAYKFVDLDDLPGRKAELLPLCKSLELRGTILLAHEGINLFLAGSRRNIDSFLSYLKNKPEFAELPVKESISDHQPFSRMLVRIKKEIISMGVETIRPLRKTSPKVSPAELKKWLDEGRDITLLDVRNDYEVEVGTFENAVAIGIDHFRRFPEATRTLPAEMKDKPLVMFCTGGIRCEKAGPLMEEQGFDDVYQLEGGILKYFEDCGGDHYQGDCFVFDKRVAVDPELNETEFEQCYGCQSVLTREDQQSEKYKPPSTCPYCFKTDDELIREIAEERDNQLSLLTTPLPGSIPYNNIRPLNVPLKFDKFQVIDFLLGMHGHLERGYWQIECDEGRITYKQEPVAPDTIVRSGWRIEHHIPQTTEPTVSNQVQFLYEDDDLVVVNKPAPLAMHACGRFNRNTLAYFVKLVFEGEQIRIVHRLDSNTTGVVVMARKKSAAQFVQPQFVDGAVDKVYVARIRGVPANTIFHCNQSISTDASTAGSRTIDDQGLESLTEFEVIHPFDDNTTLIKCIPKTGRTNQIRIHLSHLGFPIVGDPTYESGPKARDKQTISVDDPPMCLHAYSIRLIHPTRNAPIKFEAPMPAWAHH